MLTYVIQPSTRSLLAFVAWLVTAIRLHSRGSLGPAAQECTSARLFAIVYVLIASILFVEPARGAQFKTMRQWDAFYLSPDGDDNNPGTRSLPFRTVQKARDTIAARSKPMSRDIYVYLREGTYTINAPIIFTSSDSGTGGHMIHYVAYKHEHPVISGGQKVTGWTLYKDHIFKATLDRPDKLRQLYVNGQRAFMARGKNFPISSDIEGFGTFQIKGDEPWAMSSGTRFAGYTFPKDVLEPYGNPEDVELTSKAGFGYHTVSLSAIEDLGANSAAIFQEPIGAIAQSIPQFGCAFMSNKPDINAVSEFHFQNALELLNSEGQFYFDRPHKTLYYYKRATEDMDTAVVIAPVSEGLMILKGSSNKQRVENIEFRDITFAYSHYSLTKVGDSFGDTTVQSVALYTKYNDGIGHGLKQPVVTLQAAAVLCENSKRINFIGDDFKHIGQVGLSLGNDASNSKVIGNVFYDIGSSAINVGDPRNVYIDDGDFPEGLEGVPSSDSIQNNFMKKLAVDTLQAPAVSIFYTKGLDFSHNEIYEAPYTGISLGWGWTAYTRIAKPKGYSQTAANNKVDYNKIVDVLLKMHDGGGIYNLGEQPGSEIVGNYFGTIGGFSRGSSIYLDQGSRFLKVTNNYSDNPNGWFFVWGKAAQVYDIVASDNYSSVVQGKEGDNLNESPSFRNARSHPNQVDRNDKNLAGLQSRYLPLKNKE